MSKRVCCCCQQVQALESERTVLVRNISSLYRTAVMELDRKNTEIKGLRSQLEQAEQQKQQLTHKLSQHSRSEHKHNPAAVTPTFALPPPPPLPLHTASAPVLSPPPAAGTSDRGTAREHSKRVQHQDHRHDKGHRASSREDEGSRRRSTEPKSGGKDGDGRAARVSAERGREGGREGREQEAERGDRSRKNESGRHESRGRGDRDRDREEERKRRRDEGQN